MKENRVETGLLLKIDVPHLPNNQEIASNSLEVPSLKIQKKAQICKTLSRSN